MRAVTKNAVRAGILALCGGCQPASGDGGGEETGGSEADSSADSARGDSTTDAADGSSGDTSGGTGGASETGVDSGTDDSGSESDSESDTGDPPPAAPVPKDDVRMTPQNTPFVDSEPGLLANDHRGIGAPEKGPDRLGVVDFDPLSVQGGTVSVQYDGAFEYDPPTDYWGWDSFGYTVDDTFQQVSAEVWIWVSPPTIELAEIAAGEVDTAFVIDGTAEFAFLGRDVQSPGDVDGDGLDDLVFTAVGGPSVDAPRMAYVMFGGAEEVELSDIEDGTGGFVIRDSSMSAPVNVASGAGDVNGDGLADVIVSASGTYVAFGKSDGAPIELSDLEAGIGGFAIHGNAGPLSAAGDVNGDGLDDVLLGDPGRTHAVFAEGSAFVVFGKTDGTAVELVDVEAGSGGFAMHGMAVNDRLGSALAAAGDVDDDGLDDVIVGSPQLGNSGPGFAYVVFGKEDGATVDLADIQMGIGGFSIEGDIVGDEAGAAVAGLGDVNGDGFADVGVGAPEAGTFEGALYVVFGQASPVPVALWPGDVLVAGDVGYNVGRSIVGGDFDGDGLDDIAVSGDKFGDDDTLAYLVFGSEDPSTIDLSAAVSSDAVVPIFGEDTLNDDTVITTADLDGDGFLDFVVGDRLGHPDFPTAGRLYGFHGGNWRGALHCYGREDDDVLEATDQPSHIVAGAGADVVFHGGERDIIYTGAGDDEVVLVPGVFPRIDAGTGTDTLRVVGNNHSLDLGPVARTDLVDVEVIELDDPSNQTLTLDRFDVVHASATSNVLTVLGGPEDTVEADLTGGGFAEANVVAGFVDYTNGVMTLRVDESLTANISL